MSKLDFSDEFLELFVLTMEKFQPQPLDLFNPDLDRDWLKYLLHTSYELFMTLMTRNIEKDKA
jgi:hypothetical protein